MSILRALSCLVFCGIIDLRSTFETASFYGGSYITIPFQDAKSTTEIQFRFRTKQADSLLFLAAGKTDYCLLKLQSGKLKIHINLGAGESELSSPKGIRLDDLVWHHVFLSRKDGEVNVTIDKIHTIKEKLPGRYFELNIYEGLFLGGSGDSLDLFLGHFDWLRGCLSAVFYNGLDVLKRARSRTFQSDVHSVTWSCASEFDASFTSDISFLEDGAFLSLPNSISRIGARWQLEMKTTSEDCILIYNSKLVHGGRNDYVGLEITNGKLRLAMDTGGGMSEVVNEANVTDGEWHLVTVQINPAILELIIDGKYVNTVHVHSKAGNKYLDLSDMVYVGGLELNKRASALSVGMKSADKSFKGCLRNMEADGKPLGFPNVKVSQGVLTNCVWSFLCSRGPCLPNATCSQYGVDSFHCECDKYSCVNPEYFSKKELFPKSSLPIALEILSLSSVQVMEGESVLITPDNINVIFDYAKYGIRDSGVAFHVSQVPRHGSISVGSNDLLVGSSESNSVFTLLDLANDKVHYVHDGSEIYNDSIFLELEFTTSVGFILPSYLLGKNAFSLNVEIAPVNDPPFLFIPPVKILQLAEGTRKMISSDLLNATDSDNSNSELSYTVLTQQTGSGNDGFIARLDAPTLPLSTFTQEDVDLGKIFFVHLGNTTGEGKIAVQVSDGLLSSSMSFLRVSVFAFQVNLVNNTGVTLAHKSSAIISTSNLAFKTNADDPFLHVRYDIVEFPKYGIIQSLVKVKSDQDKWQPVSSFTDHHIIKGEVRYINTEQVSTHDLFKFRISVKNTALPTVYEFRMNFVQLKLSVVSNITIDVIGNQTALVRESNLNIITKPLLTNSSNIVFLVLKTPRISDLLLGNRVLRKNAVWTQKDVEEGRVAFKLHRETVSSAEDGVIFSVSAPQCETLESLSLLIKYQPTDEQRNSVQAFIRPVQVSEGSQQPLLLENLNVVKENVSLIVYQVLTPPKHGWLDMYDVDHTTVEKRNVTQFVNADILKQKVTYTHDDSESVSDFMEIIACDRADSFQCILTLTFELLLKNDNPPYCIVNNGLNVVTNGEKILTSRDLLYGDKDIDAKPESLSYTRKTVPNGAFLLSESPFNPLFEFTQNDINIGRVLFRHTGPASAAIPMWVSDGNTFSEFNFSVIASAPYVKVLNNTQLLIRQAGDSFITSSNLLGTTNMNVPPELIRFKVIKDPEVGQLELKQQNGSVRVFTQEDIEKKNLIYRHTREMKSVKDKFLFEISVYDVFAEDEFKIRMFPSVYWEPLVLVNNSTLYVDEASDALITRDDLLVQQAHVPSSDISYIVVQQPKYGYLEIEVNGKFLEVNFNYLLHSNGSDDSKDTATAITFFNQSTVDNEKLHYIQVILNQSYDRVVLDATNGIMWCRNIVIDFVIIPEQIYINSGEIHVEEGEFARLAPSLFSIFSPYYADKITEFKMKEFPRHGWLQFIGMSSKNSNVSRWTMTQLQNKQIQYVHDGSETANDSLVVAAFSGEKESIPTRVNIIIWPINDESPKLVRNTGATVWRGGMYNLNSSNLAFVDSDTPTSNITFVILSVQAGYLAYSYNLNTTIDKFTQADIDSGKVAFLHSGDDIDGEFDAIVNDGKHTLDPITFHLKIMLPSVHLSKSVGFQIFPMLRKAITSAHLLTWCADTDRNIIYIVKTPPKYGILTTADSNISTRISNFSQADINATRIWYQHTAHAVEANSSSDSFSFDVLASFTTPLKNEIFNIKIAVSSGGLDGMLDIETYEVEEGGTIKLLVNTSNLISFLSSDNIGLRSPSLMATISHHPMFGDLCYAENCSLRDLTNEQINSGISYKHDHSDSRNDSVTLTLFLVQDNITLCNITLPIIVKPINDQPFKLIQDSPNLSIIQGDRLSLTSEQLLTQDQDSSPDEIIYDIITEPSVGSLYVNGVRGVRKFTQADINSGKVVYEHFGPVQSTSFHFRVRVVQLVLPQEASYVFIETSQKWTKLVADGHFPPVYKVFNIFIAPAKLSVVVNRPVLLIQATNYTSIPATIFSIQTNNRVTTDIIFYVSTLPRYGFILVNSTRQTTFTYSDLKLKRVSYVQSDLGVASDTFELEASLAQTDSKAPNLWVNISVEPLLNFTSTFNAIAGIRNLISDGVLDASELAKKTNSNPVFTIIKKPKYGNLQRIIRRDRKSSQITKENRPLRQRDVDKFTFDEISSKVIYYVARKLNSSVEDGFTFVLSASLVQPAVGDLKFPVNVESGGWNAGGSSTGYNRGAKIVSASKSKSASTHSPLSDGSDSNGVASIQSPNITTDDYYLFVSLLAGIIVVSFIFVLLVRCRTKKRAEEDNMKMQPPLPLPRPPDHLLPSSPYPKRNTLPSTPQCKVMPLGQDSLTGSEPDFNLRYPYGAADEDWSSYDTNGYSGRSNHPSTMLRKNQYWV